MALWVYQFSKGKCPAYHLTSHMVRAHMVVSEHTVSGRKKGLNCHSTSAWILDGMWTICEPRGINTM